MQKFGSPHPSKATLASFGFNLPHSKKNDLMGVLKTHLLHKIQPASIYLQAFIQTLLSTAVFPQRFGFYTVCLVQWLRGVTSRQSPKGKFLKFRLYRSLENAFFLDFSWDFRVSWGFLTKRCLQRYIHTALLYACL